MVRNVVETIEGIGIWGVISLMIFFLCFVGITIWAIKVDKRHIRHMKNLPLDDDTGQDKNDENQKNEKLSNKTGK